MHKMLCNLCFVMHSDEDQEKLSKNDDGLAVAATAQVQPTMPHVPITTPPPDMSAQSGYSGYGNWYQV